MPSMPAKENITVQFDSIFSEMESQLNGSAGSLVHEFQKKSFNTLKHIQFPDRKHEDWKYTSVLKLIEPEYTLAHAADYKLESIPGLDSYVIEVINGKISTEKTAHAHKTSGIRIYSLNEAFGLDSWKEVFLQWISEENPSPNRAFEFLNYAFHANSFFIELPKNVILDKPIEIRIVHNDPRITFSHPLYFIRACAGSSATIFERFDTAGDTDVNASVSLVNSLGYMYLDQNAAIKHIKWQHLPAHQNFVYKLLVTQRRDSRFTSFAFDFGGAIVRNNVEVELDEPNTFTSLQAGFIAKDRQSMDHQTRINHKVPNCESHELYKGIIDGYASAAFNGKVLVHKDAQKTNAFQQNDTLVLSSNAVMNSKPQLEIFADDVKCSHGATIGQMDETALFYLRSRGMNADEAKHILKSAFLASVVDQLDDPHIREHINTGMTSEI
jgi:Fe-S cluster assembly protein SufD